MHGKFKKKKSFNELNSYLRKIKKIKNHTDPNFKAVIRTESVKERGQKMRWTLTDIM